MRSSAVRSAQRIAGAAIGTILAPPPAEVRQIVVQQNPEPVTIEGQVVVGEPLPEVVTLYPVQGYDAYTYAYVNGQRVIVDPQTRVVVEVVQ